ncbi:acyltransferase family protein [Planktotalea sp.]|uniref:acyltransferase family protein n=1 Tax=Planktotalea sp. TaxID=2029877 RepID=UPI003F6D6284
MVNGVLSMRGPVFLGKISYSLYLWHWPVFVLSYYWRGSYAGWWEALVWICVSVALAWWSWRYVETPFRRMEPRGWAVLGALALPSATALGFGALAYVKDGLPTRFDLKTQSHIQASGDFLQDFSRCYVPHEGAFGGVELCPIGPEGAPQVLIWGDSHVRAFKEGLEQAAWEAATPALIIWHAGCAPLFGVRKTESYATPAQDEACTSDKAVIARDIATLEAVRDVLLVGRWSYYASGRGVGLDAENTITLEGYGKSDNAAVLRAGLAASLPVLQAQFGRVHVLEQMPELPRYDSREAARLLAHGRASEDDIAARSTVMRAKAEARYAQAREAMGAAPVIKMWDAVCTSETCSALQGTASWYFDNNHITNTAAKAMAARFSPLFEGRLSNE